MIIVDLAAATICFLGQCYPALVGNTTPTGEFTTTHIYTDQAGYGGDFLSFKEDESTRFAIHRVWLLRPEQKRLERLASKKVKDRYITSGCVNVSPEVYEMLVDCCAGQTLVIKKGEIESLPTNRKVSTRK